MSALNWQNLQNALADSRSRFSAELDRLRAEAMWQQFTDFMPDASLDTDLSHLGNFPQLRRWVGDKVLKNAHAYTFQRQSQPFEASFEISKWKLKQAEKAGGDLASNLGLMHWAEKQARAAADWPDILAFEMVTNGHLSTHPTYGEDITCFDGQPFFDTAHPNGSQSTYSNEDTSGAVANPWFLVDSRVKMLIFLQFSAPEIVNQMDPTTSDNTWSTGNFRFGIEAHGVVVPTIPQAAYRSTAAPGETALDSHRATVAAYVDDQGGKLGVIHDTILYGPSNAAAVEEIVREDRKSGGDSNNRFFNRYKLVYSPRLA